MKPLVSLAMIVRDGAETLGRCLGSVVDLVDEVVVVDTGSTDSSREVARGFGARVFDFAWTDSFAEARNESLRRARGRWAFWLDADEWLDKPARGRFRALVEGLGDDQAVYLMQQSSHFEAADRESLTIAQPRLFRVVEDVRWQYRVHEQILEAWRLRGAPFRFVDLAIRHSGYQSVEQARRKSNRNHRLMELDLEDRPDDPWALFQLGRSCTEGRFPEAEPLLLRALASSGATPLMARQARAMLARGYREQGDATRARAIVLEGLRVHPDDSILLFESGTLALQAGDLGAAEAAFRKLLDSPPDPEERLIGADPSLRGWRSRTNLASACARGGRPLEAEEHWRVALRDQPGLAHAMLGLGELYLAQARWDEFDRAILELRQHAPRLDPASDANRLLLQAQGHLARREFAPAREFLIELIDRDPAASNPRMLLGWSYLLEGKDLAAAERALREVLRDDPGHAEARRGLDALAGLKRAGASSHTPR